MNKSARDYIINAAIVLLIVANILTGSMIYVAGKPKCMCDGCSRIRVSGTRYCSKHADADEYLCKEPATNSCERVIWLEVKNRN